MPMGGAAGRLGDRVGRVYIEDHVAANGAPQNNKRLCSVMVVIGCLICAVLLYFLVKSYLLSADQK